MVFRRSDTIFKVSFCLIILEKLSKFHFRFWWLWCNHFTFPEMFSSDFRIQFIYPVLINPTSPTWNIQVIKTLVDTDSMTLSKIILLRHIQSTDIDGWHFTQYKRYIFKFGYEVFYPDIARHAPFLAQILRICRFIHGKLNAF